MLCVVASEGRSFTIRSGDEGRERGESGDKVDGCEVGKDKCGKWWW